MKPAPFHYHTPSTIDETLDLLAKFAADDGRVLAGGQSLVPTMAFRLARPRHLIDINGIRELDYLEVHNGKLCIGAGVRHAAFARPVVQGPLGRLLAHVVRHIAHAPIRNRGGLRVIAAKDFFKGIMTTALRDDELLSEVRLPILPADARVGFAEFSRRAGDFAVAMAVTSFRLKNNIMSDLRIAVGGAEAAPRRHNEAERVLLGRPPNTGIFQAAASAAARAIDPLDDVNLSDDYRRSVVRAMVSRALEQSCP
jgi:aerobic carbon-monoxide dehydrogenase medium subunit